MNTIDSHLKHISSSSLGSVKDQLVILDVQINRHKENTAQGIVMVEELINDLRTLVEIGGVSPNEIQSKLSSELSDKGQQIARHLSSQKGENLRMTEDISDVKVAFSELTIAMKNCQAKLAKLRKRINGTSGSGEPVFLT